MGVANETGGVMRGVGQLLGFALILLIAPFVYLYEAVGKVAFWLIVLVLGSALCYWLSRKNTSIDANIAQTKIATKPPLRKRREAAVFNAKNHRRSNEIKAREAAQKQEALRDGHSEQYQSFVAATRTLSFSHGDRAPAPSNEELRRYFNLLDALSVNLLSKREQIDRYRLQYQAAVALNDGMLMAKTLGAASALAEVPSKSMPYCQFSYDKLPDAESLHDLTWIYQEHAALLLRGGQPGAARAALDHGAKVLREFGFEMVDDAWYDVLETLEREAEASAEVQAVIDFVRKNPGTLQADFLKNHDLATSEMLYWMAQRGEIIRVKSGRTYALSVPVESAT